MSLDFLTPSGAGGGMAAAGPLEPWLREAGARFEERDGWLVASSFGSPDQELAAVRTAAGIADRSEMGKLELQGTPDAVGSLLASVMPGGPPPRGEAGELDGALVWHSSPDRAMALCEPVETRSVRELLESVCGASPHCGIVDLTAGLAAIELRGPRAGQVLERLTAIDVRESRLPPGGVQAGSVAEVAATLLRPTDDAFLILVGAQEAPDAWEIVLDAGAPLGARPVGTDALLRPEPRREAMAGA